MKRKNQQINNFNLIVRSHAIQISNQNMILIIVEKMKKLIKIFALEFVKEKLLKNQILVREMILGIVDTIVDRYKVKH